MNISDQLAGHAHSRAANPAIEHGSRIVSYGELRIIAENIAVQLRRLGVEQGDIVGLIMENSVEQCALMWAVALSGAVIFPLQNNTGDLEIKQAMADISVKLCVLDNNRRPLPGLDTVSIGELTVSPGPDFQGIDFPVTDETQPFKLNQSSGTTGKPKSFMFSHAQVIEIARQYRTFVNWDKEDRLRE